MGDLRPELRHAPGDLLGRVELRQFRRQLQWMLLRAAVRRTRCS
jgi:hypothetical protein